MHSQAVCQFRMKRCHQHVVLSGRCSPAIDTGQHLDVILGRLDLWCPNECHGDCPDSSKIRFGEKTAELAAVRVAFGRDGHASKSRDSACHRPGWLKGSDRHRCQRPACLAGCIGSAGQTVPVSWSSLLITVLSPPGSTRPSSFLLSRS